MEEDSYIYQMHIGFASKNHHLSAVWSDLPAQALRKNTQLVTSLYQHNANAVSSRLRIALASCLSALE